MYGNVQLFVGVFMQLVHGRSSNVLTLVGAYRLTTNAMATAAAVTAVMNGIAVSCP